MHSVTQTYFATTSGSDFRTRTIHNGEFFPFDAIQYDNMEKESYLVGMVMAWSVITLESLVNHALAEIINNKILSIMAIEYPGQITDKLKVAQSAKSELAKKIAILSDDFVGNNNEYIQLADELSQIRNAIVHDKPFELIDLEDGDVKIQHFKSRKGMDMSRQRYEDLSDFYRKCDKITVHISSVSPLQVMGLGEISFINLING